MTSSEIRRVIFYTLLGFVSRVQSSHHYVVNCSPGTTYYPTLVRISKSDDIKVNVDFCNGVLVSSRFVMTIKSCVEGLGEVSLLGIAANEGITYEKLVPKEGIKTFHKHDTEDLMLIEMNDKVVFNPRIFPACLMKEMLQFPPRKEFVRQTFNPHYEYISNGHKTYVTSWTMNIFNQETCSGHEDPRNQNKLCVACSDRYEESGPGDLLMYIDFDSERNYFLGFGSDGMKHCSNDKSPQFGFDSFPWIEWVESITGEPTEGDYCAAINHYISSPK